MIVAYHTIDNGFCTKCGRTLCDILSYADIAKLDDPGISCSGNLTADELVQLKAARAEQLKAFERVMA